MIWFEFLKFSDSTSVPQGKHSHTKTNDPMTIILISLLVVKFLFLSLSETLRRGLQKLLNPALETTYNIINFRYNFQNIQGVHVSIHDKML